MSRLDEILALVKHVPPFPKVAQRVMDLLKEDDVNAAQLAEVIQYDQAITANVLKMCNASYFGLPRKVTSLDDALVILGHDTLKDIIIASSSAKFYVGKVGAGYQLEQGEMWKHSVAVGIMAKLLVRHIKDVDPGSAFTCGLLHDIGKRFLSAFVSDEFQEIMEKVDDAQCSFVEAEKALLGMDHAELGGVILERWEFPRDLVDAVREHHDPRALEQAPLTALISLSNSLVVSMGIGVGADGLAAEMQGEGLKKIGVSPAMLQVCMMDLLEEMDKAEEMLNL
ncbi:MAG: HDOD domain-containing protein [Desulfobulbaceae bacterium]|uniref:HDOD domain-containing protein n=1 Tax=Candidatus Desulfobia pelagia TaxID=2841692 RepID=A0A8J6NEW6_9BACT|nr:HDOD domain-containing protein [Candidatus Desulfobia pelagia]